MYSEALRILDANTVQYMVEEQKKEILTLRKTLEDQSRELATKDMEIQRLNSLLNARTIKSANK